MCFYTLTMHKPRWKSRKQSLLQHYRKEYLGGNVTKETKDLYNENCKILLKEIKDDTNK